MARASHRLSEEVLGDLQGLIASGYGHLPLAAYLFVRFHDAGAARAWIGKLAGTIASARPWPVDADGRTIKPRVAVNVAFTVLADPPYISV